MQRRLSVLLFVLAGSGAFALRSQAAYSQPALETQEQKERKNEEKKEAANALAATTTVPQFAARRGGTLGIPAASARDGLQAAIDILNSEESANAFVKLEGISLTPRMLISVVAETFEESLPRVVLGTPPATTELFVAKLPSVGARLTLTGRPLFYVSAFQSPECIKALGRLSADAYASLLGQKAPPSTIGTDGKDKKEENKPALVPAPLAPAPPVPAPLAPAPPAPPAGEDSKSITDAMTACNVEKLGNRKQTSGTFGLRALRRSAAKDASGLSDGLAAEAAVLHERSDETTLYSLYASSSYLWLQERSEELDGTRIEYPKIHELRFTVGGEIRGTKLLDTNAVPRLGVYGTAS